MRMFVVWLIKRHWVNWAWEPKHNICIFQDNNNVYDVSLLRFPHKSEGLPIHMSSIVARRFDEGSGSCQYLIRNSWGSSCGGYYSEKYECKNGHVWVPQKHLTRMVQSITYIE